MRSTKRTARIAGLIYLAFAVLSVFSFLYVPSVITVSGDATATAGNIVSSELLFRAGIVGGLVSQTMFVFLVVTLYRLFNEIDHVQAVLMVTLVAVGVAATFANTINRIAALVILSGAGFLSVFEKPQLDALAYTFLRLYGQGAYAIDMFWGLWLFPFGLLVIKSRFIPGVLGVLLMIAGFGYLLHALASLLVPQYSGIISQLTMPLVTGELPIIFWLLIKGARAVETDPNCR